MRGVPGDAPFRPLDHTADVGLVIRGRTESELFANAAAGLADLMIDRAAVRERTVEEIAIDLPGSPLDELLREFLSEILFRFHARKRVAARAEIVSLAPGAIRARLHGEEYDRARHGGKIEVKGVTFHRLALERKAPAGPLEATVVFDV